MRKEEVDIRERAAEAEAMMWVRSCPLCNGKLSKYTLEYAISCEGCGWVWL